MIEFLHAEHLSRRYGVKIVLDDVSFNLNRGQAAALVGENGAGKTTLARILVGLEEADSGTLRTLPGMRTGYLPQEVTSDEPIRIRDYIARETGDLAAMEARLRQLETDLSSPEQLEAYGQLLDEFTRRGGYAWEARMAQVLDGLGVRYLDDTRLLHTLSGGEKTRVHLAALLLSEPDLLVLDEPTNHLDVAGITWLETTLAAYAQALLIITHDRVFIDRVASHILELSAVTHTITAFAGSYGDYLAERERRYTQSVEAYQGQRAEMQRLKRLTVTTAHNPRRAKPISDPDKHVRYRMEQTAQNTQSKTIRDARERLHKLEENHLTHPGSLWSVSFPFQPLPLGSATPLRLTAVSVAYGEHRVLAEVSLTLNRGDRVVLMAPNGSGKTTLIRLVAGLQTADAGQVTLAPGVRIGLLDQEGETLDCQQQVLAAYNAVLAVPLSEAEALTELHRSGLFADASLAHKPVGQLSTGQRRKLQLAQLVASRANLLLLDEPTNHLDLLSVEALEEALTHFTGAVLAVSHDRRFAEHVATHLAQLEGGHLHIEAVG